MEFAALLTIVLSGALGLALRSRVRVPVARAFVGIGAIALMAALAIFGLAVAGWRPLAPMTAGFVASGLFFFALVVLPFGLALRWAPDRRAK
jgi:hypothetical protein